MRFVVRITQLSRVVFALSFAVFITGVNFSPLVQLQNKEPVSLSQFDMLTITSGWVLLDQHLFWTSDAGQTWQEIGPSVPSGALLQDVEFKDTNTGWMLWTMVNADGNLEFQLAYTTNHGSKWSTRSLSLFAPGEIASNAEKAEMGWFDLQTGWISVKQNSGSNFSMGTLFTTSDGGKSWNRFLLPVADKVYFSQPQVGWAVGGPANDQLFETQDSGASWKPIRPAATLEGTQTLAYPPFSSGGQSLLVTTNLGEENSLNVYTLKNTSESWSPLGQVRLDAQPGRIGLSILDARNFVAVIPGTKSIVRMTNGELDVFENQDGLSTSIVELDMASLDIGWAKSITSSCATTSLSDQQRATVSCSSATRLLQTTNGGRTWQKLDLPSLRSDITAFDASDINKTTTISTASGAQNTATLIGQGFDKCEIPTLSQMQTWSNSSPYKAVNLYIGGSNRGCGNSALISSYLFLLYQQGWKFIPTWVGPQAPCTGYLSRMSSDVTLAYQQGVEEANLAVERLAALGLTDPDQTGSVIYYDIENYGIDTGCRAAVNSFMNGWVSQVRARGSLAGVYGSTLCNTGLSDFLHIANIPDVIWPARWYHNLGSGYYDPTASVWNLGSCIPNTVWSNHQRVRQYEGDHNEAWGNLSLDIDSDVLDGVVAIPYDYPFVRYIVRADPNPTNASSVAFTVNFSKSVTGVSKGDFVLSTSGVTGASISGVSGSGATYSVTVNTGSGSGTIRLDVVDDDSIRDGSNNPLGSAGIGNGNVTSGEIYTKGELIDVYIGGERKGEYILAPHESTRQSYKDVSNGPLNVTNVNTDPMIAAERVIYKAAGGVNTSFMEMMGLPKIQLDATYWLPWYNNVDLDTQLRFGNVTASQTATVQVYIGGQEVKSGCTPHNSPYTLAPGESIRVSCAGVNNGPVQIKSDHGVPLVAAERVIYKVNGIQTSFSEMMALPNKQLDSVHWLPWYNNVDLDTQLRFGNVTTDQTATVRVWIGKQEISGCNPSNVSYPYVLDPGQSLRVSCPGINSGPVKIESDVPIVAAERVVYKVSGTNTSFTEMMALPNNQLDSIYWLPWYNNMDLDTQLRFGNVDPNLTATVHVKIGGVEVTGCTPHASPFTLQPGESVRVSCPGLNNGPVQIESDVPIVAAERVVYKVNNIATSFSEMMALPNSQLDTAYWMPWYNNVDLDTQLRFGVP